MPRLLFLCNALDDDTRLVRGITTDSPAASRKVFMTVQALRSAGIAAAVVSFGRGRRTGGPERHQARVGRVLGVPVCYLPFNNRPVLSELGSAFAAAAATWRLGRRGRGTTLLVYNRALLYLPALLVARLRRIPIVLDLEDGSPNADPGWRGRLARAALRGFDRLCGGRALLACTALEGATALRPTMPYYGIAATTGAARLTEDMVTALLGGTVAPDTGGELLADAVERLRLEQPAWARQLSIEVTGKGASIERLRALASQSAAPRLKVWGRLNDEDYAAITQRAHVGLSLKLNQGGLAQTTFPSKVVEMASAGQLVVATDISDVRRVLGDDGALYLTEDSPAALAELLRQVVEHRDDARRIAERGTAAVTSKCAPMAAGRDLAAFLFPRLAVQSSDPLLAASRRPG